MKKAALIILLSLMLTACSERNTTAPSADEQSENASVNVGENIEKPEEPSNAPVFFIDGELPDIGNFSGSSYDSYFGEPTYDFVPGEYSKILPFIDSVKDFGGMTKISYGLCDESGKTIMDASDKNSGITFMGDENGYGIYRISKAPEYTEEAGIDYDIMAGYNSTVIVDGNGKWSKVLNGGWCDYMCDGIISATVRIPETNEFKNVLYDYNGEEILYVDDYDYAGEYGCGLLSANKWEDDTLKSFFINLDGDVVLGPYRTAFGFNKHGFSPVTDFEDNAHIIDTNGRKYTDNIYSNASLQTGYKGDSGVFVMTKKDATGEYDIYSADAQLLGSISDENISYVSLRFPDNGEILYNYTIYDDKYTESEMIWRRLSDGSDFVSRELGIMPNRYLGNDNYYVCTTDDNKGYIIDCDGETVAVLDNFFGESLEISEDGRFIAYNTGEYAFEYNEVTQKHELNDTRRFTIYDSVEKQIVYEADRAGFAFFVGDNSRYIKASLYIETDMFSIDGYYVLFDTKTGELLFDNCIVLESNECYGDWYYNVCTENACTLYDEDFNVIRKSYYE